MTKKHFIALAQVLRNTDPRRYANDEHLEVRFNQWNFMRAAIADLCKKENPAFDYKKWGEFIDGKCGQNGGAR